MEAVATIAGVILFLAAIILLSAIRIAEKVQKRRAAEWWENLEKALEEMEDEDV